MPLIVGLRTVHDTGPRFRSRAAPVNARADVASASAKPRSAGVVDRVPARTISVLTSPADLATAIGSPAGQGDRVGSAVNATVAPRLPSSALIAATAAWTAAADRGRPPGSRPRLAPGPAPPPRQTTRPDRPSRPAAWPPRPQVTPDQRQHARKLPEAIGNGDPRPTP